MPSIQTTLSSAKKAPKKRRLSLAVSDIFRTPEPLSDHDAKGLKTATRLADIPDFPEGQDDPAQAAELERQQDA
jgi:hypothetical protein